MEFGDAYGTRTRVTAVKGRCLNRLTNAPCPQKAPGGAELESSKRAEGPFGLGAAPGLEPVTLRV